MCPGFTGLEIPTVAIPEVIGDVCWQAVAPVEDQLKVYELPDWMVTGPSEPLALMSTVTGGMVGGTTIGAARPTTTESVAFVMPFVQVMVRVTGALTVG